jgi:hypothetical protein
MKFEGKKYKEIAKITGYSIHSLRKYFSQKGKWSSEYYEWLQVYKDCYLNHLQNRFIAQSEDSFSAIIELSKNAHSPNLQFQASKYILDQAGFHKHSRSITSQESSEDPTEAIFQRLEEIKLRKQKMKDEYGNDKNIAYERRQE